MRPADEPLRNYNYGARTTLTHTYGDLRTATHLQWPYTPSHGRIGAYSGTVEGDRECAPAATAVAAVHIQTTLTAGGLSWIHRKTDNRHRQRHPQLNRPRANEPHSAEGKTNKVRQKDRHVEQKQAGPMSLPEHNLSRRCRRR